MGALMQLGIKGKTIFHNSISNLSSAVKLCWFCMKMNNQLFLAVIVVASVLLTVSGTKTKSKANSNHGYCNLLNDQTDEYFELVFEYKNMVEDLEAMRDRFLSVSGVVNSEEAIKIYYHSNSIRFQMNRAAYDIVRGAIANTNDSYNVYIIVYTGMHLFRSHISEAL